MAGAVTLGCNEILNFEEGEKVSYNIPISARVTWPDTDQLTCEKCHWRLWRCVEQKTLVRYLVGNDFLVFRQHYLASAIALSLLFTVPLIKVKASKVGAETTIEYQILLAFLTL